MDQFVIKRDVIVQYDEPYSTSTVTDIPPCWTPAQYLDKLRDYEWLLVEKGAIGCKICKLCAALGMEKSQGLSLNQAWKECKIVASGQTIQLQQKQMRAKIFKHKNSEAHLAAQNLCDAASKQTIENAKKGSENQNEDDGNLSYDYNAASKSSTSFVDDDENLSLGYSNEPYDDLPRSETAFEDCGEKEEFVMPASFNRKRKKQSAVLDGLDPIGQDDAEKNTEFDIFGNGVAAQLNNLPFVNALELQLKIQQLISRYRMSMQNQSESSTLQVRSPDSMNNVGQKQNGSLQEYESKNAILSNEFDEKIFVDYVASSIRNLRSAEDKAKLKLKIQKGISEMSDVDKSISGQTQLKTAVTPQVVAGSLNDGLGTGSINIGMEVADETIKEEPIETEIGLSLDPLSEDPDTFTPAFKKRKTDSKTDSNLADTLNMISGNYLSDSKKAKEFELFGSGVAAQLNNMPFINAIELQSQIQQLISQYRLNYAHCKIKQLQT